MLFLNILLIPFSVIILSIVGKTIINKNFIYNFAFGWLFISLVLAFSSYIIPNYTRELIFFIILITFFIKPNEQLENIRSNLLYLKNNFSDLIFFFIFSYFLFIEESIFFVKFLANNVLHHGLAIEMLTADYFGPMKYPNHYPLMIGAFHLLSNSTLAALNVFSINPNLHLMLETKLIVTCIFLTSFLISIFSIVKNKFTICIITLVFFLFFFSEIKLNYEVGSNYLFLIFALLTIQIFHDNNLKYNEKSYLILLLLIIQFHTKAPIGYIFIPIGIYVFFKNIKIIKKKSFWLISLVSLIVVLNLILIPKGNGWLKAQTEYKIVFTQKQSLVSFVKYEPPFYEESLELRIIDFANSLYLKSNIFKKFTEKLTSYSKSEGGKTDARLITSRFLFTFLIVLFFLIKFYFPLIYINNKKNFNIYYKEFNIFLITTVAGWIFVRNSSGFNLTHQSYIYFYVSMYAFPYMTYYFLLKSVKFKYLFIFFIYGILNYSLITNHNHNLKASYYSIAKIEHHLFEKQVENCNDKKFSKFIPNYSNLSSIALSKGSKLFCKEIEQKFDYGEYLLHRSKR